MFAANSLLIRPSEAAHHGRSSSIAISGEPCRAARHARQIVYRFSVPIILLVLWEAAVRTGVFPATLIAAPSNVLVAFYERIIDLTLFTHAFASVRRIAIGFVLGAFLGISLGTAVGISRTATTLIESTMLTLIPIPGIAWIPLLIIVLGIGEASKIFLVAISGLCTLFIPTAYGIRSADKDLVEVAEVLGKNRLSLFWNVLFPSAIPNIMSALRVTLVAAWTLLISAEVIASSDGLGWLIWDARRFSRPDDMIVGMIAFGILGKLSDSLLVAVQRYLTRYRSTYGDIRNV